MLFTSSVYGQSINIVSGLVSDGETLTIQGYGFGENGPTVIVFDDFEGGTHGDPVADGPGSAPVGEWYDANGLVTYSNAYSRSGSMSFMGNQDEDWTNFLEARFTGPTTDYFLSYSAMHPHGWPGGTGDEEQNWKVVWVQRLNTGEDDKIFFGTTPRPRYGPYTNVDIQLASNDSKGLLGGQGLNRFAYPIGNWYDNSKWFQGRVWMHGNSGNDTFDGDQIWWTKVDEDAIFTKQEFNDVNNYHVGYIKSATQYSYGEVRRVRFNGWATRSPGLYTYFDDLYLAEGPYAQARVEIGNKDKYDECTILAICPTTSWSDDIISANIRTATHIDDDIVYLYVVDANGTISPSWGPFIIGQQINLTDPYIGEHSGDIIHNNSVTLTGANFGPGATVITWDMFDVDDVGTPVQNTTPRLPDGVSPWTGVLAEGAFNDPFISDARSISGTSSARCTFNNGSESNWQSRVSKYFDTTESIYFSYWRYCEGGEDGSGRWGIGSKNHKTIYLFGTTSDRPQITVGATMNGGPFGLTNNQSDSNRFSLPFTSGSYLVDNATVNWDNTIEQWNRWEVYTKVNDPVGTSNDEFQAYFDNIKLYDGTNEWMRSQHSGIYDQISFGYMDNDYANYSKLHVDIDNFYIATTRARIEMGDQPTFEACTVRLIQPHTNWVEDPSSATVIINTGTFIGGTEVYFFVVDENGTTSSGYGPVTITDEPITDPTIYNVQGITVDGNAITINGINFGSSQGTVYIGNASSWDSVTTSVQQTVTDWDPVFVDITIDAGSFTGADNTYLFVIDSSALASNGSLIQLPLGFIGTPRNLIVEE